MISSALTALSPAYIAPVEWMIGLLKPILVFFHDSIGVGWGMSIVLLTICVRACLAPLTVKQFKSMQAMVRVAPELKALQAKHKDDKQRQQQEVMKFYAENKINPFASCLPLVAQMPFFIGLFYTLQSDLRREICGGAIGAAHFVSGKPPACGTLEGASGAESFLFIPDLTAKATGWVLAVLIVLYVGSQLLSSILTPSTADRNQRLLMYALPFVFLIFIIRFPAGLIVYWITTNLWTVTQGYVLRRRMGPISMPKGEPALAGIPAGGAAAAGGGGFMARLSAAAGAKAKPADEPAAEPAAKGARSSASSKTAAAKSRTSAPSTAKAGGAAKSGATAKAGGAAKSGPTAQAGGGRARSSKSSEASATTAAAKPTRDGPPPPPPRKKKKRSGRRR